MNRNRRGGHGGGGMQRGPINTGQGLLGAGPGPGMANMAGPAAFSQMGGQMGSGVGPGPMGGRMGGDGGAAMGRLGNEMGGARGHLGGMGNFMGGVSMKQQGMMGEMHLNNDDRMRDTGRRFSGGDRSQGQMDLGRGILGGGPEQDMLDMRRRSPPLMNTAMQGQGRQRGEIHQQAVRDTQLQLVNNLLKQQQPPAQGMMGNNAPGLLGNAPSYREMGMPGRKGGEVPGKLPSLFDVMPRQMGGKRPGPPHFHRNQDNKRMRSGFSSDSRRRDSDRRDSRSDRDSRPGSRDSSSSSRRNRSDSSSDYNRRERRSSGSREDHTNVTTAVTLTIANDSTEISEAYDPAEPTADDEPSTQQEDDVQMSEVVESQAEEDAMIQDTEDLKEDHQEEQEEKEAPKKEGTPKKGKDGRSEMVVTVTVGKKGRSVNDSDSGRHEDEDRAKSGGQVYQCHACSVRCHSEHSFSLHMNGAKHKRRMEEMMDMHRQKTSQMMARLKAESHLRRIEDGARPADNHCRPCDRQFSGSFRDHKQTAEHKTRDAQRARGCRVCSISSFLKFSDLSKHFQSHSHRKKKIEEIWPYCRLCNMSFKSPRKFVLHCKTPHHLENKRNQSDLRDVDDDIFPDDFGEMVTVDEVGFEEDSNLLNDSEDVLLEPTPAESETAMQEGKPTDASEAKSLADTQESVSMTTATAAPVKQQGTPKVEMPQSYNPEVAVGQHYIMPVTGFYCKLCHKFYKDENSAKGYHCKSESHFDKYQKLMKSKRLAEGAKQEPKPKQEEQQNSESATKAVNGSQSDTGAQCKEADDLKEEIKTESCDTDQKDPVVLPITDSKTKEESPDEELVTEESGDMDIENGVTSQQVVNNDSQDAESEVVPAPETVVVEKKVQSPARGRGGRRGRRGRK